MKANNLFVLAIAAAAGCGAVTPSTGPSGPSGDDDTGSGTTGSGSDTGSGSGTAGAHAPGPLTGHIKDERADSIDFSTGVPVHNHTGSSVDLSSGCPAVYKYAYLTSTMAPIYGQELTKNPLSFQVQTDLGTTDANASEYRVRTSDGQTLLDWTSTQPDANGVYTMELHRDDAATMAALGTYVGKVYIDARFHDMHGVETLDTACWENHPLAAPLQVFQADVSSLFTMSLPAHSPLSIVLNAEAWQLDHGSGADTVVLPIVQTTAEPVTITLATPNPTGSASETGVDMYLPTNVATVSLACGPDVYDPGCDSPKPPAALATSTAVALTAAWTLRVIDVASATAICGIDSDNIGTTLSCTIPARLANEGPRAYRAVLAMSQTSIAPSTNVFAAYGEYSVAATTGTVMYTGTYADTSQACTLHRTITNPKTQVVYTSCSQQTTYSHVIALDKAHIDFDAIHFSMLSSVGEPAMPVVPVASLTFAAHSWDAGDAGF